MTGLLAWIVIWALRSTIVIVIGGLAQLAIRHRSAATKNMVWRATIVGVALVPALGLFAPAINAPVTVPVSRQEPMVAAPMMSQHNQLGGQNLAVQPTEGDIPILPILLYNVYALGVLAILWRWIAGIRACRKMVRSAEPLDRGPVWIARDPSLSVPITFGWRSPVILLPSQSTRWPEPLVEAAIAHESAHIQRRDWVLQGFGMILIAFQWFNPAIWLAVTAMRSTAEDAADDSVLVHGVQPSSYAGALLNVASGLTKQAQPGVAMVRKAGIAKRLARVVAPNVNRQSPTRVVYVSVAALLLLAGGTASALRISHSESSVLSGDWGSLFYSAPPQASQSMGAGVGAELVTVREIGPKGNVRWWSPDGEQQPIRPDLDQRFPRLWGSVVDANHRQLGLDFRLHGIDTDQLTCEIKVDGGTSVAATTVPGGDYRAIILFRKTTSFADISFGVAYQPFSSLYNAKLDNQNLILSTNEFHFTDGSNQTRIFFTAPEEQVNLDYQAVVHLRNGKAVPATMRMPDGIRIDDNPAREFDFPFKKADIVSAELLARPMAWVKFQRIKLYPNGEVSL